MIGKSENYKLDTYFTSLRMEMEPIMYVPKGGRRPMNIISALQSNTVLCFDLVSVTNSLLLNTVIYQLKLALKRGIRYQIIIDSIPINYNDAYASYIRSPSEKVCKTIVADDFYAMTDSDEKVFSAIVGNSQVLVVMAHTSGQSAVKWAEVFGQYDKLEESYSASCGGSSNIPFSDPPSLNYNRTINVSRNREYIVKPEAIMRMANGEAYVFSAALGGLAHLRFTG